MTVGHNGINAVHNNRAEWIDGDRLVADARRAVHEALVVLPAPEADRVRSLIADLETAVEARTAMRVPAVPVSSPPPDQTAELERLRTENDRMRHELEVMYGGAFDSLHPAPPACRAALIAATARACATHLRDTYSDTWTADAARSLELNAARIERGEPTALLRRLDAEAPQPETGACLHPDGCDGECPCPPSCGCCTVTAAQQPEAEPTSEQIVRDHVTTLHLIGEQLANVETWMWEHLADVRAASAAADPAQDASRV